MPSANTRYFLSADGLTQCAVPMTDLLHPMIWGVASYSSQPWDGAEIVRPADPLAWLEDQMAVRLGRLHASLRIDKVRAGEVPMQVAA